MGDDAVQLARGHHKVAALLGLHQGRDACRYDRHPQPGCVQMAAVAGLGREQPGVRELQGPAQPLRLGRAEAVHAEQGSGADLPHQCPGQLLQTQPGGSRHARCHCRHRPDALHRDGMLPHRDENFLHGPGAEGIGGHPPIPDAQHQHRPCRRQQGLQLCRSRFDDRFVPLVQQADAGHFQRHVPPAGALQPFARDLYPRHGHAAAPGCGHPHTGGRRTARCPEQLIGKVCFPHGSSRFPI